MKCKTCGLPVIWSESAQAWFHEVPGAWKPYLGTITREVTKDDGLTEAG